MDKVAIVILNYKTWEDTLAEAKLCNELLGVPYEDIIIVDNASPNESAEELAKKSIGDYVFIKSDKNSGYAAGNNIGLRYAYEHGYSYGWILNNDIIIEDSSIIEKIIKVFKSDDSLAVVNPDIYAPDGHMFNRDSIRPSFMDLTLGMMSYRKKGRIIKDEGGYGRVYRPQGCCMMVDLKKLNEIDYLDERTFLYMEEMILAERLLKKDYYCACCTEASIVHNHSTTVKSSFDKKKIRNMTNKSFAYYLYQYRGFSRFKIKICCMFNSLKLMALD